MPDSVLLTKLHRPETGGDLVCRPRLHALLDAGLAGPPTLISAPAGYGKTTLLSQWLESRPEKCAWVSLDERDSHARAFLQYLVAAVRTARPEACAETYDLLAVPNPMPVSVLLRSLTNELDALEQRLIGGPALYRVTVQGHIRPETAASLGNLRVISTDRTVSPCITVLKGELRDQAELSGILNTLYDLHIPVLEVTALDKDDPDEAHEATDIAS